MSLHTVETIVGSSAAIDALRAQILHLAAFDTPRNPNVPTVLLQGETGTGKGLVAFAIHSSGGRARGPFVDVNCAAIPETMLEAELFGFEAGAFTDAKRAKPGLFEAAGGGSLFLDEIDALPLPLQGKLLKAIEEKSVRRLGAVTPQRVDVKLIAATQRNVLEMVAAGAFRADLYHRLAVVVLDLPPLRARPEDVLVLAAHYLAAHAVAHGVVAKTLDDGARRWLVAHPWPGNVRELAHLMERATLLCLDETVDQATLERLRVPLPSTGTMPTGSATRDSTGAATTAGSDDGKAARLRDALARSGGNVVGAARLLGIGRNALRHRMRRYGIERPRLDDRAAAAPATGSPASRDARTPIAAPPAPSWEVKPVAVLALELVLPEDAYEPWTLAQRWTERIAERVAGFGGVFLARSASRATAVFGIPRSLEQLPQRAVQAALAIHRLLADAEPTPELRLAVHLGSLRVDTSSPDPTATVLPLGDTVALAERLLGHAGAGDILVSAAVARRVEGACELRPRELRIGAADRLDAYAVAGRRTRATLADAPAQTRFVGRDRELAQLRECFASAAAGRGLVVFVVGEAGLGKSRLLLELRQALGDAPHLWIEGRCASYGTTTAFLPIIDALRRFFAIDDRDDDAAAGAKIERGIAALGADLAWTVPLVRQVLSLAAGEAAVAGLDSASRRSETFRALKAMVRAAAERQPLVLVVEDLHWIDPASEEYLAFIADAVPAMRVLLVCSHRPGYRHPFGDQSYHARVMLQPLTAGDVAAISGALLGAAELPAEVQSLIAAKAEGNPFFVEEVTRSLIEDGTLQRRNGHVVLTRDAQTIVVPGTIHDVLSARLDRLAGDARHAIQVASVIGREFALRLLERIVESGDRVRTQVDELRALELIYEKATHPELAYMFKHALTHDVAYESLVLERRRELHLTIGRAIEELYADRLAEFYETLAHHFGRAEDWERALAYHERAAEKAAESFANRSVITHCREALATADRLGARVSTDRRRQLEERLALAHFYVSEFGPSGDAFERAAEGSEGAKQQALNVSNAFVSHFWAHAYDASARGEARLRELARREDLPFAEALAMTAEGFRRGVCDGNVTTEQELLIGALRIAEREGDEASVATMRFYLAQSLEWTGDYAGSIALGEQVIAAGRRLRLAHLVIWPGWFLGKALCCLGEYGRALAQLTEAYEVCDRIGDRAWKSRLLNTLGWCHAELGSHVRGREYNERAAAVAREIGDPEILANSEINLAGDHLALGDLDGCGLRLEPIASALAKPGDPWMRWRYALHAFDALGRLALARNVPDDALAHADAEIAGARRHRAPKVEARALVLRGEALVRLERRADAEHALAEAVRVAGAIHYPRAAWQALGLLAELARRRRDGAALARYGAQHRALIAAAVRSVDDPALARTLYEAASAVVS